MGENSADELLSRLDLIQAEPLENHAASFEKIYEELLNALKQSDVRDE